MKTEDKTDSILLLDQYGYLGGGQRVFIDVVASATATFTEVVVCIPRGGALEEALAATSTNLKFVDIGDLKANHGKKSVWEIILLAWRNFRIFLKLFRIINRTDLIYINGGRLFIFGLLSSIFLRKKVCYHIHIMMGRLELGLLRFIDRLKCTEALIVNSEFIKRSIERVAGQYNFKRIVLISNSLGKDFAGLSFRCVGKKKGLVVVTAGVIRPEKGQNIVFELARFFPLVTFHLVGRIGDGAEIWFRNLMNDKPGNLQVHPPVADLPLFISAIGANVSLTPSVWEEPFGLVAIEGMACSCVGIVARTGGLSDIAEVCEAYSYLDMDELRGIFELIQGMSEDDFIKRAFVNYNKATTDFAFGAFASTLNSLFSSFKAARGYK